MKKIIVLIFSILGFGGAYILQDFSEPPAVPETREQVVRGAQDDVREEVFVPEVPVRIRIPTLDVDAVVEHVAKDSEGRMDVPKEVFNTAWYELGAMPGEVGNAVIAGHLDTPTGAPSIFYHLNTLSEGDEIHVEDAGENIYTYEVVDVVTYPTNSFPIEEVFGEYESARLNLITCGGVYDQTAKDYLERTVVFSELEYVERAE